VSEAVISCEQEIPAVAREDTLEPIHLLLHTDFQDHPRSMIFLSFERQYATSY